MWVGTVFNWKQLQLTFVLDESTATVSTLCVWPLQMWIHSAFPLSRDHYTRKENKQKLFSLIVIIMNPNLKGFP